VTGRWRAAWALGLAIGARVGRGCRAVPVRLAALGRRVGPGAAWRAVFHGVHAGRVSRPRLFRRGLPLLTGVPRRFVVFQSAAHRLAARLPAGASRLGDGLVRVLGPVDVFLAGVAETIDGWAGRLWRVAGPSMVRGARLGGGFLHLAAARAGAAGRSWTARVGTSAVYRRVAAWPFAYRLAGAVVALAVVLVPYQLFWAKDALNVTVAGRVIGQVTSGDEVWLALGQLEETQSRLYGLPAVPMEALDLVPVHGGGPYLSMAALRSLLGRSVHFGVAAAGISVDGQVRFVLKDAATAEKTLRDYAAGYAVNGGATRFEEDVQVVPVVAPPWRVVFEDQALQALLNSASKPATYTVGKGDTLWDLAGKLHTTVDAIAADNPGMDVNHLALGEVIYLERPMRLINVLTTYPATMEETVPYPVQWRKDSRLSWGQEKVVQAGRLGEEQVVAIVTEENGNEVSRRVLEKRMLQAPVPKIVATGGDIELASRGGDYHGGRLMWPASGPITSPFGWRTIFGHREFHTGIDIGAGYGQGVVAAAPGVVTFTGWESGYGYMVVVGHGDGLSTAYAHLSRILVRTGQSVGAGSELGLVGETGDATGPHVHFEVRVDGTPVNPMNFL